MAELVADCPRCDAKDITFDVTQQNHLDVARTWPRIYEVFCVCRRCKTATTFVVNQQNQKESALINAGFNKLPGALNRYFQVVEYVSVKNLAPVSPPEYLPPEIEAVFREGATCLAVNCYNAAGTMFRLCIDLATRSMLPPPHEAGGPNGQILRNLGLRLPWLIKNGLLPAALQDLSSCVREDGNDGAHAGTLGKLDAEDLLDFTTMLLERLYTEPEQLRLAAERRISRRNITE